MYQSGPQQFTFHMFKMYLLCSVNVILENVQVYDGGRGS